MKNLEGIIKSQNDTLNYKAFELENRIKVIFVEDKTTKKSAAVMNVGRGSLSDPVSHQGLAHFLEHMLFMGSEKYPKSDHYRNFINQNGGDCNAMTSLSNTVFYHSINKDSLLESLDILAQFFLCPLMDKSMVDKEMKAVHSEFQKSFNNDDWKEFQILRTISHPESIFNKFLCGNEDSLKKDDIYLKLKEFHSTNYSSNIMTLAVYHDDIEAIQNQVLELFKGILDKNVPEINYTEKPFPFTSNNLAKVIEYKSIKNEKTISLTWFLQPLQKHFKSPPLKIISHLIGHESEGSIHSMLMDEHLIYNLSASSWNIDNYMTTFSINISLTDKGYNNIPRIIQVISEYINLLKKGIPHWVYEEIKTICEFQFAYLDKSNFLNKTIKIAENVSNYPIEFCNKLGYLQETFEEEFVKEILNNLTSDKLLLQINNSEFEDLKEFEPIYKSGYNFKSLDEELKNKFDHPNLSEDEAKKLHLPPQNYFIPEKFDLVEKNKAYLEKPVEISENVSEGKLFFKQDSHFNLPKSYITYHFFTHTKGFSNIERLLMRDIWIKLLNLKLKKFIYLAQSGKTTFKIMNTLKGLNIEVDGFSDKMAIFMEKLAEEIKYFIINCDDKWMEVQFEKMKNKKLTDYDKELKREVYRRVLYTRPYLMLTNCYSIEQKIEALKLIDSEKFKSFFNEFLREFYYEALYLGNETKEQSLNINKTFMDHLKTKDFRTMEKKNIIEIRVVQLEENKTKIIIDSIKDPNEKNDCILMNYELSQNSDNFLKMKLLEKYFETPFFEELRTEKQLGYVVFSLILKQTGVLSFQFLIQSNVTTSMHCVGHIHQFLKKHLNLIKNLDDKIFEDFKHSIVKTLTQPFNNLKEESSFYCQKMTENTYDFDWKNKVADLMNQIKKNEIIELYEKIFFTEKKLLEYHLVSQENLEKNKQVLEVRQLFTDENTVMIQCENELKKTSCLYPDIELKF